MGCASGEEAYSLAILASEYAAGLSDPPKIQIFATDVDDDAIAEARDNRYPETIEADVTPERLQRFFVKEGEYYRVRKEIREMILFAPHNILRDPPFSRTRPDRLPKPADLSQSRNAGQGAADISFRVEPGGGFLFLGNSESAEGQSAIFAPVDKKHRIYARRPRQPRKNPPPYCH